MNIGFYFINIVFTKQIHMWYFKQESLAGPGDEGLLSWLCGGLRLGSDVKASLGSIGDSVS